MAAPELLEAIDTHISRRHQSLSTEINHSSSDDDDDDVGDSEGETEHDGRTTPPNSPETHLRRSIPLAAKGAEIRELLEQEQQENSQQIPQQNRKQQEQQQVEGDSTQGILIVMLHRRIEESDSRHISYITYIYITYSLYTM